MKQHLFSSKNMIKKQILMMHPVRFIIIGILFVVIISTAISLLLSNLFFETTEYKITSNKISRSIRVVQLSDLHNASFGTENNRLVKKIKKLKPDVILITGDLIRSSSQTYQTAVKTIEKLSEIAPVYLSLGNHEIEYQQNFGTDLSEVFTKAGAIVLNYDFTDISIGNQKIRIGGFYGKGYSADSGCDVKEETEFLTKFENTNGLKLLMAHVPTVWMLTDALDSWNIDAIFSGHTHGGQIRIPFVGALYAPDQGYFPGREEGLYYSKMKDHVLVLSRGLGSNGSIPRFNNIPQIMVIDFEPEK